MNQASVRDDLETVAALRTFAKRRGRSWRDDLHIAWTTGQYRMYGCSDEEAALLQRLRNTTTKTFIRHFKP